jgi:transcriptional regulator with XRE-family HTH domain
VKTTRLVPASRVREFRLVIRARLRAARRRNPRYSLRAFAQRLEIDHSTLSQIMRGKRRMTAAHAARIGPHLGLSPDAMKTLLDAGARPPRQQRPARRSVDRDTLAFLAEWPHGAILELTHVDGFRADSRWIAGVLGIPVADVNVVLQRLIRLRLLEMKGPAEWRDLSTDVEFSTKHLSESMRRGMVRTACDVAGRLAVQTPTARRAGAQAIVAMNTSQLARLRAIVDEFVNDIRALAAGGRPTDVYHVVISALPLTTFQHSKRGTDG